VKASTPPRSSDIVIERLLDFVTVLVLLARSSRSSIRASRRWTRDVPDGEDVGHARRRRARRHGRTDGRRRPPGSAPPRGRRRHRLAAREAARPRHQPRRQFAAGLAWCAIRARRWRSPVVPLWFIIAAQIWLVSVAVGVTLPPTGALLIMALVVGVAVPTPGAMGASMRHRVAATAFFGADNDHAVGAAIVLHAVGFVPTLIAGAGSWPARSVAGTSAPRRNARDEETRP
jgi:hypothetical protein